MAVELEQTIMKKIGLGQHYNWFNGSGSCQYIADEAINKLPHVAKKEGLSISSTWLAHCREAWKVDRVNSQQYGLTNVWIACSYAIQDAIYRKEGGKGFAPQENWVFWSDKERQEWERRKRPYDDPMDRFFRR